MPSRPLPRLALLAGLGALALGAGACNEDTPVDPTVPARIAKAAGDSQTVKVGSAAVPLAVLVTNVSGAPLANTKVFWVVSEGGGKVADTVSTTDANGRAQMTYTAGTAVDTAAVSAIAGLFDPAVFTIFQEAEAASRLIPSLGHESAILAGKTLQLGAKVTDKFGNPIKGVTVAWATSSGTLSPAASASDSTGQAVTTFTLPAAPGDYTATASVPAIGTTQFTVHAVAAVR